ncbi:MAG: ABC transporter ATP-binding protein [Candidatus Bipolaricaulia bacterium]
MAADPASIDDTRKSEVTNEESLVRTEGISKEFPGVWEHLILDHIDFDVYAGEIHALLGENGAGKTVLANILSGFYVPTKGQIYVNGKPVSINSPKDGLKHGIGMVHQELMLARPFTVAENVALGLTSSNFSFPLAQVERQIRALSERYRLGVNPKAKIEDLSAGEQQRVEIIKVLYYDPKVLILDEPTSLLTPEESEELFVVLRKMAEEGYGIVFITHKFGEVMAVSDRVTVLRLGKVSGRRKTSETDEKELTRLMLGERVPVHLERKPVQSERVVLELKDLHVLGPEGEPAVKDVSFSVREGEIFGIAGVAGNGQRELLEAITGLRDVKAGQVIIFGEEMTNRSPKEIIDAGVAHIPEERRRLGVSEPMYVAENVVLKDYRTLPFSKRSILNTSSITRHSKRLVSEYSVLVPDLWRSETRILSGGNIQRLILARETWRKPPLIIAAHPTYGLDLKAIKHTWELFLELREQGSSFLLVSEDLDEVMSLSDRIAVMFNGQIVDVVEAAGAKKEGIGLMMAGGKGDRKIP